MSYGENLAALLVPLGVYSWAEGAVHRAELDAVGHALDGCGGTLEETQREMLLSTARDEGLTAVEALLPYRPVTEDLERRRAALAALLRIGGDSFTLEAVNDNLAGCGLNARAEETDRPNYIRISFPEVPGIPEGYGSMRRIIEEIIPCHLGVEYVFWYITWGMMEARFPTWGQIEAGKHTWDQLEKMVY